MQTRRRTEGYGEADGRPPGLTHGLGAVERQYLGDVERLLSDLPAPHRRLLVGHAAEHLAERPPAAEIRELWAAIGMPRAYAAELRSLPLPEPEPGERASRHRRAIAAVRRIPTRLAVFAVAAAVFVAVFAMWWYVPTPEISASGCTGVIGDGVEELRAAQTTEWVVPYEPGGRFTVSLCLTQPADDGEAILLGTALPDRSRVWRPVDIGLTGSSGEDVGTFGHGETIAVPVGPSTRIVELSFEMLCDPGADGGQSFESIPFEIRHDRKTFILDLDLGARVTLDQAAQRC